MATARLMSDRAVSSSPATLTFNAVKRYLQESLGLGVLKNAV